MIVLGILGFVVALFVVAGVIDLKGRRRGVRYSVGSPTVDPGRAAAQAEANMRSDMGGSSGGF